MMKNFLVIWLLLCSVFSTLSAQSVNDELKKLNTHMDELSDFSLKMTYSVFPNYYSNKAIEVTEGSMKKSGEKYITTLGPLLVCNNGTYIISADEDRKHLIVANVSKTKEKTNPIYNGLDTLIKSASEAKLLKLENGINRITLNFRKSEYTDIDRIEIYYDTKTYFLNKINLYYSNEIYFDDEEKGKKDRPKLEMKFEHLSLEKLSAVLFSTERFFTTNKKELTPAKEFQGYTILDQRLKK